MIGLFRRHPLIIGILCALLALLFLYLGIEQYKLTINMPEKPEIMTIQEVKEKIQSESIKLWVELADGFIDCESIEYWEGRHNFVFVTRWTTVLVVSNDYSVVLQTSFSESPTCKEMISKPLIGVVSKNRENIDAEIWQKNMNGIQKYSGATLFDYCTNCTTDKEKSLVWELILFSLVWLLIFIGSVIYQIYLWKNEDKEKKEREAKI